MHLLGGSWLLVEGGLMVAAVGAILVVRRAMADDSSPEDWHESVATLAGEVHDAVEGRPVEVRRLREEVVPLANRLEGRTRSAPPGADEDLLEAIDGLTNACHRLAFEAAGARRTGRLQERLDELEAMAGEVQRRAKD